MIIDTNFDFHTDSKGGDPDIYSPTLKAYESFFKLFETFQGYTNFFLLNDLVDDKYNIKFFLPFSNFNSKPILSNKEQYLTYKNNALNFIKLRNQRIINYINSLK